MISVGVDVSKGKSTVCILKPYGEIVCCPFEVLHMEKELDALDALLNKLDGEIRIGIQVMLFAIEEQSDIHYAMPLKVLNGDAALYDKQWNGIRREHKRKKDLIDVRRYPHAERFRTDLKPVFGAVIFTYPLDELPDIL